MESTSSMSTVTPSLTFDFSDLLASDAGLSAVAKGSSADVAAAEAAPSGDDDEVGDTLAVVPAADASKHSEAEHFMSNGDMRETMLFSFMESLGNFLMSASRVFPTCPVLKKLDEEYTQRTADLGPEKEAERRLFAHKVLTEWQTNFKPYYDLVQDKDADRLFESDLVKHPLFKSIHIADKWKFSSLSVRATVFEYLRQICEYANVYTVLKTCPDGMFGVVQDFAKGFMDKIKRGELSMQDLQNQNLEELGKQVLGKTSEADKAAFASALKDPKKMDSMLEIIQSMMSDALGPNVLKQVMGARAKIKTVGSRRG